MTTNFFYLMLARKTSRFVNACLFFAGSALADPNGTPLPADDITQMEMKDLLNMKVTSVSKKAQSLSDAPSAVYVISNEDIKRSGATSLPEALRLAPGIDVARINSNSWAVSARGFNGSLANKLLVLIDGRSVYTPSFSGVYWDAQDVMLEDIDRIEVIRGPGATLWGSNAVNGVINIITRSAEKTQGGLLVGGGGSMETGFGGVRYGAKLSKDTFARAYVKGFERDRFDSMDGSRRINDNWGRAQGGFRLDSRLSEEDEISLNGNVYRTSFNQQILDSLVAPPYFREQADNGVNEGWNLTSRIRHQFSSTNELSLQFYYDHSRRLDSYTQQWLDTLDLDFQHSVELFDSHNVIWGLGYRVNMDKFADTRYLSFTDPRKNTQIFSAFLQDEIELVDNSLWLTVGSKFEHNDFSGFEGQPGVRLLWAPTTRQRLWAAFSRSVRTPSRYEQGAVVDFNVIPSETLPIPLPAGIPAFLNLSGNERFQSEVQLSYELGYRLSLSNEASIDVATFYSDYDKVRSASAGLPSLHLTSAPHVDVPLVLGNMSRASTWGVEASTVWQMAPWLRWDANYTFIDIAYNNDQIFEKSPEHKISLRALLNPTDNIDLDLWLKYNGDARALIPLTTAAVSTSRIDDYLSLDARLAWRPAPSVELSLVGQNLLSDRHLEYYNETYVIPTLVPRSFYGKISVNF